MFVGWLAGGAARVALVAVREALRARLPQRGIRWVADADLHLTLCFLGDTAPGPAACLAHALPGIAATRHRIRAQAGAPRAWPDAVAARVLVVEVDSRGALEAVAAQVQAAARGCALAPDARPFRAHVTLARLGGDALPPCDLASLPAVGALEVDRLALLDSAPREDGTRYRELAGCTLGGD